MLGSPSDGQPPGLVQRLEEREETEVSKLRAVPEVMEVDEDVG